MPLPASVAAFDRHATAYDRYAAEEVRQYEMTLFLSKVKGKRVLDLGCGSGIDLLHLASYGYRPVGVDRSPALLALAQGRIAAQKKKVYIFAMDVTRLGFAEGAFFGVWCHDVLSYLSDEQARSALAESYRVLKGGCIGYFSVAAGRGRERQRLPLLGGASVMVYPQEQLRFEELLAGAGFSLLQDYVEDGMIHAFVRK